ncbi:MAG: serine hydrolase domain-containing protein [Planctomycetota bacterium]
MKAPGGALALTHGGQTRSWSYGFADDSGQTPMPRSPRMRLGSVTKLYLAAVVLQLVDEGVLDLDDPIGRFVDGVPNGERITLRMLGRHTSGLDDAIRQMPFHAQLAAEPQRIWQPDELLAVAFEPGPRFEPGERWAYSNANSLLLALAVEQATGTTWREHVQTRIIDPLDLEDTGFDQPPTVRGYRYGKRDDPVGYGGADDHLWFDATDWSASWTGPAGEMTGTAKDTAVFIAALFGGDLLSADALAELTAFEDTGDSTLFYGFHCHGVRSEAEGLLAIGHHGDVPGFSSSAAWLPESRTAVVVLANLSAELDKWSSAIKLMNTALDGLADDPAADATPAADPQLAQALDSAFHASNIRGVQVATIEGTHVAALKAGDGDKRFRAGSVSKLLTALLVMRAVEAGVVELDAPVEQWLPGAFVGDGHDEVTLAHLLEHTAGVAGSGPAEYAANEPGLSPLDYVATRRPFRLRWRPGLHYSYSNPGYAIAAAAVTRAWGQPNGLTFDDLMHREVLAPLGMANTTFDAPSPPSYEADGHTLAPPWAMPVRPAGSAVTTADDLAKVVAMLMADGDAFLTPESVARIERGETGVLAKAGGGDAAYGLGTFAYIANDHALRAHWGKTEGFRATLAYTPSPSANTPPRGYVLLVDTADDRGISGLRRTLNQWTTQGRDTGSPPPANTRQAAAGALPSDFEGVYVGATHDTVERTWLMGLLGARRLTPTPDGVVVEPLFLGGSTRWERVGGDLYRMQGLPVASGATWHDTAHGTGHFWIDGESYRQQPAAWVYGQAIVLVGGLVAAVLAVVTWSIAMALRIYGRKRRASDRPKQTMRNWHGLWPHALALAGVANQVLVGGFVVWHLSPGTSGIAQLGRVSPASLTLATASVVAPAALLVAWVSMLKGHRTTQSRRTARTLARLAWPATLAAALTAMTLLLGLYGLVPYWPA